MKSVDYIIVGAGSAGCCLANRLSEHATVLLVEAGPPDVSPDIHNPSWVLGAIEFNRSLCVPYQTLPQTGLNQRVVTINRGVVRGGCTSVNGMIYVRGNRRNYDHWAELGNDGWGFDDVLPYFKRSESYLGIPSPFRGSDGPLSVRPVPNPSPVSHAFVAAAANLGPFPHSRFDHDLNGAQQEDIAAHYDVTVTRSGKRASNAVAFLDPISKRQSLTVKTSARVNRVVIENDLACGVEVHEAGRNRIYRANREVILAAGAFESPKLLMLSGIGPADHLLANGIRPRVDLPGVGANLQDHLMLLMYCLAPKNVWPGVSDYLAEAGLFTNVLGSPDDAPDLQFMFQAGMTGLAVDPRFDPNFIINPVMLQPESRGWVRLRSADPAALPVVEPSYLDHPNDMQVMVRGVELARDLIATAPLSEFWDGKSMFSVPDPFRSGHRIDVPPVGSSDIVDFVRANATTVWHPSGTCKMGSDEQAVVDAQLRVRGISGLRVADASVMPRITSGNTSMPTTMIAEKAADMIYQSSMQDDNPARFEPADQTEGVNDMYNPGNADQNIVDRLVSANVRSVEGGLRCVSRWCELSAQAYPLAVRLVCNLGDTGTNKEGNARVRDELRETVSEMAGLPLRACRELKTEIEGVIWPDGGKPETTGSADPLDR